MTLLAELTSSVKELAIYCTNSKLSGAVQPTQELPKLELIGTLVWTGMPALVKITRNESGVHYLEF